MILDESKMVLKNIFLIRIFANLFMLLKNHYHFLIKTMILKKYNRKKNYFSLKDDESIEKSIFIISHSHLPSDTGK